MSDTITAVLLLAPVLIVCVAHRSIAETIKFMCWLRWAGRLCRAHDITNPADVLHLSRPDSPAPPVLLRPVRSRTTSARTAPPV